MEAQFVVIWQIGAILVVSKPTASLSLAVGKREKLNPNLLMKSNGKSSKIVLVNSFQ